MTDDSSNQSVTKADPIESDTGKTKDAGDSLATLLFFCLMGLMLLALLFLPWTYRLSNSIGAPAEREYLGVVQKITYVGGLGPDTQVDTESRTLLLRGAVVIQKGVPLEQRMGLFDSDVCIAKTDQCWHLMGS